MAPSLTTVLYALLAVGAAYALGIVRQRASVRKREADFRLEQRRRQGIPDEDTRPYDIALRDVQEKKRRADRERGRDSAPQIRAEEGTQEMRERDVDAGVRQRGSLAGRRGNVERNGDAQPQPRGTPSKPRTSPRRQVSQAQQPRARQPSSKAPSSGPSIEEIPDPRLTRSGPTESAAHGKRRKRDDSSDDSADEEEDHERTKGRAIRRRRNTPDRAGETAGSASEADQPMEPEMEEQSEEEHRPPVNKGKKRELDDVDVEGDAESSVGRRRRTKRGRIASRTASAQDGAEAQTGESGAEDHDMEASSAPEEQDEPSHSDSSATPEEEEIVLRTRRGTARRPPPRPTPRRTRAKPPAKAEITDGQRKRLEEWTDAGGIRWMIGKDGFKRRAVTVKEMRNKYNMPKDSKHPDRLVMHKVLVEKWLTDEEFHAAKKAKKLGWQSDDEDSSAAVDAQPAAATPNRSLYYSTGTMSPRRGPFQAAASALRNVTPGVRLDLSRVGSPTSSAGTPNRYSPMLRGKSSLRQLRAKPAISEAEDRERTRQLAERMMREAGEEVPTAKEAVAAPAGMPSSGPVPSLSASAGLTASAPAAPSAPVDAARPAPAFSFGSSAPSASSAAPAAAPSTSTDKPPASNPFGAPFGSGATTSEKKASPAPSAPFSFGAAPTAAATEKKDETPTSAPAAVPPAAPKPASFSFGDASKPATPAATSNGSSSGFSFGAPAAASSTSTPKAAENKPAAPATFSFGSSTPAASASKPASTPAAGSGFTFGSQAPPAAKPVTFGAAPPSNPFGAPIEAPKAAAPTPAISFGASKPAAAAAAPAAPFTFGSGASAPTSPFGAPANNMFGKSSAAPSAPAVTFGAPAASPAPAAGGFTFSAGSNAPVFSAGSGTPPPMTADGQRIVKGNRRLNKAKSSSNLAPGSPGPGTPPPSNQPFNFKF